MRLTDTVLVGHILFECEKIQCLVSEISYAEFRENTMYQDALIRPLEVIGEAAGNLSPDFVNRYPALPVQNMRGMRNLLAHQYFRVDLDTVWETVTKDIMPVYYQLLEIAGEVNSSEV